MIQLSLQVDITAAGTSLEPLLFENIGQLVSGLSYVHTHIPINISELELHLHEYRDSVMNEFSDENLQATYKQFLDTVAHGPQPTRDKTLSFENLQFLQSKLALWPQIAAIHKIEIDLLQTRINALYLTLPKPDHQNGPKTTQQFSQADPYSPEQLIKLPTIPDRPPQFKIKTTKPPIKTTTVNPSNGTTLSRKTRFVPLIVAGIGAALGSVTAGTAFGLVTKNSLETLTQKINDIHLREEQVLRVLQDVQKDLQDNSRETKELIVQSFMDRTFDSGIVIAKLRAQLNTLRDRIHKLEGIIQQAQHHRLSVNYLSPKNLLDLFQQVQSHAKRFGYRTVIERPSELFQLDASYTFDGTTISLLLHVPIAPPEAFMRLYKLHPFPLPFDNGTLLTHNVKNEILAISNSNHRFIIQMSSVDLLGCHQLGKTYLCQRNGLLNKYPEDSCLGSLYHQKFEIAHQLCDFKVEPAKEFIYQLLNNWFMIYEPTPITVPVVCTNGSHSELHVRRGISKFHLTAGCTADFPRYKLLSDISILIPQDYIQLEMDWDPVNFLPGVREFLIPEIDKLNRMGATMTSLSTLQSMVASRLEDLNPLFHWVHFGFNSLTVFLFIFVLLIISYRCWIVYRSRLVQQQARQLDLAVRTALNRNPSVHNVSPTYLQDNNLSIDHFDSVSVINSGPARNQQTVPPPAYSYRPSSVYDFPASEATTTSTVPRH